MFGYITINKDELKIKDYNKYQSYYCGVCHSLKTNYGLTGQMTLTYDMTFLAVLLSSLYEDDTKAVMHRCMPHPVKKHSAIYNEYTDYAAAMNVLLTYHKLKDDWEDERSIKSNTMAGLLKRAFRKASALYPRQSEVIAECIRSQREYEENNETSIDTVSQPTGRMLGEIFDMKQDEWSSYLKRTGFFLGKFIYILDAYDDLEKDIKKNNYNPLIPHRDETDFKDSCERLLITVAAESSRAFEALPILDNGDILRNILYSGVWSKFYKIER
ncbi:MAG: DUF5685 family protein [Butyrivibrio sp.]